MSSYTIIGTGTMAQAIASVLTAGGASVQFVSHQDLSDSAIEGDTVILAVPYPALTPVINTLGDQLDNKTVVDITNPLDFSTFDSLVVPADSSAAAELQSALPNSRVLKAFNTTFAATLADKSVGPNTTTVLVAGNDSAAKDALIADVVSGGIRAKDAGSLDRARELEAIGFLQLTLAVQEKISWTGGFAVID